MILAMKSVIAFVLMNLILQCGTALGADWPHWRGPNFDGSSPETGLPDTFSKSNNVRWVATLPGPSAATPIVRGDRLFVSSTDTQTRTLRAICLDARTGRQLWNHEVTQGFQQDDRSNLASPSPTTDGRLVYFYYGTGDLVAFDFAGKKVWSRNIQKDHGPFAFLWTYAASPTLFEGRLYIQVLQRDVPVQGRGRTDGPNDSYLLALDPQTGRDLWRHVRPSDAVGESREAYSTPIPCRHEGRAQLLITGGDCITSHNPEDGTELWRWGTWNPTRITHWRLVPSPVTGGGVALACGPKGAPVYAVKLSSRGTLDDSALAWVSKEREISSDVCTPLFYRGRFYVLNGDRKTIARVDPATGKPDWIGELGTRDKIEASPTAADGKIYFQDFRGRVFVVNAGEEFKLLHMAELGDPGENHVRSSIAIADGCLFVRTSNKLYCLAASKAAARP
jgi:outer membrane protein assembly factor BamB